MTKQLSFSADLALLEGTIETKFGRSYVCIPIRNIKIFMEGRNPKTNERVTAVVLSTNEEFAFIETFAEVKAQYEGKLDQLLTSV